MLFVNVTFVTCCNRLFSENNVVLKPGIPYGSIHAVILVIYFTEVLKYEKCNFYLENFIQDHFLNNNNITHVTLHSMFSM